MKRKIIAMLVISAALTSFAAGEPDPSAWYKPSAEDYIAPTDWECVAYLEDARGMQKEVNFNLTFDEYGNVVGSTLQDALGEFKVSLNTAIDLLDATIRTAVQNTSIIERLEAQFVALGKNLTKIFQIDGMRINSGGKTFTLRIPQGALKNAVATGSTVEYTDEDGLLVKADDTTLTDITRYGMRVIGWKSVPTKVPSFAILKDNGEIGWIPLKVDDSSVEKDKNNAIAIKGWSGARCDAKLSDMLSNPSNSDRDSHAILTRVGEGSEAELHYLPIGDAVVSKADGVSIVEKEDKTLVIGGYEDASEGNYLRKTSDGVEWASIEIPDMPDMPDVPDVQEGEGIIIYRDWDDDNHEYHTFGVDTNYLAEVLAPQVDKKSIVLNEKNQISLVGADSANSEEHLVKIDGGYEWRSVPWADGNSIYEKDDRCFVIAGYDDAEYYTVPTRTESGLEWLSWPIPMVDGDSIIEKPDGTIGIAGVTDAGEGAILTTHGDGQVYWRSANTIQVVVDVRLDPNTQKLQKKIATLEFHGEITDEGDWTDL